MAANANSTTASNGTSVNQGKTGSKPAARPSSEESSTTLGMAALLRREVDRIESTIREGASNSLQTTSDELKLQAHLGMLDARDRMALMETFTQKVATRLTDAAHVAAETGALQVSLGRMDLKDALEERTQRARTELRQSAHEAGAFMKTAWRDLEVRAGALARDINKII